MQSLIRLYLKYTWYLFISLISCCLSTQTVFAQVKISSAGVVLQTNFKADNIQPETDKNLAFLNLLQEKNILEPIAKSKAQVEIRMGPSILGYINANYLVIRYTGGHWERQTYQIGYLLNYVKLTGPYAGIKILKPVPGYEGRDTSYNYALTTKTSTLPFDSTSFYDTDRAVFGHMASWQDVINAYAANGLFDLEDNETIKTDIKAKHPNTVIKPNAFVIEVKIGNHIRRKLYDIYTETSITDVAEYTKYQNLLKLYSLQNTIKPKS